MATATIHLTLNPDDRAAIDDLTDATDALVEALDDYIDVTTDTTIEFGEPLEDRLSPVCRLVQTAALVIIAITLICR